MIMSVLVTSIVLSEIDKHMLRTPVSSSWAGLLKFLFAMVLLFILYSIVNFFHSKDFETFVSFLDTEKHNFLLRDLFVKDFCDQDSKRTFVFLFKFLISLLITIPHAVHDKTLSSLFNDSMTWSFPNYPLIEYFVF